MKRLAIVLAVGLVLAVGTSAHTAVLTFEFDPNDLLDLYPTDHSVSKTTQTDARRVHETWGSNFYNTFNDYMAAGHTQPTDYNTYRNWRDGLGENEGLGSFSTWLHGDPAARAWGETLIADPSKPMSATAASGWNVTILDNPWDTGYGAGYIAVWWTTDPTKYLRPGGADIGMFTFTADVYVDSNADNNIAGDQHAQGGVPYRIWFADTWMNQGDEGLRALVFDNQGWGTLEPNDGTFASATAGDSALEAVLDVAGMPVPEPVGLGLVGLALLAVRKKRS